MQVVATRPPPGQTFEGEFRLGFIWMIAFVAAMGGLLFGYDWVVIGGAKPFYEAYFHLDSAGLIGWANSCALIGCFAGSLLGGRLSDHVGRKKVLVFSALLFAISSLLTGWAYSFAAFINWRIIGGVAIGLASNISPMYIAEISPAAWRGRLVSLNQLAIVIGILAAQVANWAIAERVPEHATRTMISASWNARYGWRWMFTAVAVPAVVFLLTAPFIPESPRWLVRAGDEVAARCAAEDRWPALQPVGADIDSRESKRPDRGATGAFFSPGTSASYCLSVLLLQCSNRLAGSMFSSIMLKKFIEAQAMASAIFFSTLLLPEPST